MTDVAVPDQGGAVQTPAAPSKRLLDANGDVVASPTRADVESRLAAGQFFWLDMPSVGDEELTWMRDVFKLHPLAVDDAEHFSERPKLEEYDGYAIMVLYGSGVAEPKSVVEGQTAGSVPGVGKPAGAQSAAPAGGALADLESVSEVHCVVAEKYVLTIHRGNCPVLVDFVERAHARKTPIGQPARLVYRLADTLVESFFPVLSELDDRIDALQAAVINRPDNEQLGELLDYRSSLIAVRRVVAPQRDLFASLASGVTDLPGFDDEDNRYLRDVYDSLIHLSDLIDGYRDLLSGTTDAYLSVVSNQLNVVMKQLSIIATVFLPLSFLTGFFGQNFSFLTGHLNGWDTFVFLGLGTEVIAVAVMVVMFRRLGWLGKS